MLKTKTVIGKSTGPHVLITAGVHGDEFEPMAAVRQLILKLPGLVDHGRVTLVPCVNEGAFARGARVAEDGSDLARTCPGNPSGSITQKVAHALSELIRSADFYIDLHTGGTLLELTPLAGYMLHPKPPVLEAQQRMARAFNLPIIWGTHPGANGRSLSVARDADIPAIYTETGGGGIFEPRHVEACVQGCLNVLCDLRMLHAPTPSPLLRYFTEDPRDQSGHLQVQHPATMAGLFEPAVELGDNVEQAQIIGHISDLLGEQQDSIVANENGIVIMLRTFRRVLPGEALVALLPRAFTK